MMLEQYLSFFVNRSEPYFQQYTARGKVGYRCVRESVTLDLIRRHLAGEITLSFPATSESGTCKWAVWDCDTADDSLDRIESVLIELELNPLRESKRVGRSGHTWLLFDEPLPPHRLLRFDKEIRAHAGVSHDAVEFFPKSTVGLSQIRGPLGLHRKPGVNQTGWFEDAPHSISDQIAWLGEQSRSSSEAICRMTDLLFERDLANRSAPPRRIRNTSVEQRINILDALPDKRWSGREFIAQCPLCAREGHDRHRDNLRVSENGETFTCVFGGPGKVHKAREIALCLGSSTAY